MQRFFVILVLALAALSARAEWVSQADATDAKRAVWCNAQRTACIVSRQSMLSSYLRVALVPGGVGDCILRRIRYTVTRTDGTTSSDVRTGHGMIGASVCLVDIPQAEVDGTRSIRFSVPMLTQPAAVVDLPLDGFVVMAEQLPTNRTDGL